MSKLPYKEGDWFAVPLRDESGFAVGRIARMAPNGRVLLGYFFGPPHETVPTLDQVQHHRPEAAAMIVRFGDLYLINGRWPILGGSSQWRRQDWPMPVFGRQVEHDGVAWKVEYPDDNPNANPRETRISIADSRRLPSSNMFGAGVVEAVLTKQLAPGGPTQ